MFLFSLECSSVAPAPPQPSQLRRLQAKKILEAAQKLLKGSLTPSKISQVMSPMMMKKAWKRRGVELTPSKIKEVMSPLWLKTSWATSQPAAAEQFFTPPTHNATALSYDQIA